MNINKWKNTNEIDINTKIQMLSCSVLIKKVITLLHFLKNDPNQTTEVFKYWCLIVFVYAYQAKLSKNWNFFQNNYHMFKLPMFDMQYWKCI